MQIDISNSNTIFIEFCNLKEKNIILTEDSQGCGENNFFKNKNKSEFNVSSIYFDLFSNMDFFLNVFIKWSGSRAILRDQSWSINWRDLARLARLSGSSQRRITRVLGARTTLQEELEETLRACEGPLLSVSTSTDRLESLIKKKMHLYGCGETGVNFYRLLIIACSRWCQPVLSLLLGRYIATEIRWRLSDSAISRYSLFFKELFSKSPLELDF